MPLKKPSTRKSLRAPKLQESEVGEGSSPAVARQLEFTPKTVSVIKTITKEPFVQAPSFRRHEGKYWSQDGISLLGRSFQENQEIRTP
jgi:hypothetical protein